MTRLLSHILVALAVLASAHTASAGGPAADVDVGAGLGCGVQCITKAWVTPSLAEATVEVRTDTPARLTIRVSDQAPGYIDGTPWIPNPDAFAQTWGYYTSRVFELDGLAAGTLYHILVTATDSAGRTAHQLGTFRTLEPPPLPPAVHAETVHVTFYKVKVLNDADSGAGNRGEISLGFAAGGETAHTTGVRKLGTGQTYRPPFESHAVTTSGSSLELTVSGVEFDGPNPIDGDNNDHTVAVASVDLENLHDQVVGDDYGGMPFGHDAYVVFESPDDDYLELRVYAWIDVVSD